MKAYCWNDRPVIKSYGFVGRNLENNQDNSRLELELSGIARRSEWHYRSALPETTMRT